MDNEYILEMRNITKEFPGVKALDNVNFKVKRGEIIHLVSRQDSEAELRPGCQVFFDRHPRQRWNRRKRILPDHIRDLRHHLQPLIFRFDHL